MKAATCKVCGEVHWLNEPHQFPQTKKPAPEPVRPVGKSKSAPAKKKPRKKP